MTHSPPTRNPTGGAGGRRAAAQPALDTHLMERVVDTEKVRRAWKRVKASVTRYLTGVLQLSVNEQKSRVAKLDECVFLGFTFLGTKLRWSDEAYADCRHRLRHLTGRSWGVSMQYRLFKLREYLRGWMGYSGISDYYRPVPELDHWLRRRVRLCYWKQRRRVRTKVRHLMALGTRRQARFKRRVREITRRNRGHRVQDAIGERHRYVTGWLQYFGISHSHSAVLALDECIRRRVRLYYWKQWQRPRTRRRHLIALGIPPAEVRRATRSRKGYWRMSASSIVQRALTNRWLHEHGVPDLRTSWIALHYGPHARV